MISIVPRLGSAPGLHRHRVTLVICRFALVDVPAESTGRVSSDLIGRVH